MNADELAEVIEDLLRSLAEDQDGDPTELRDARIRSYRRAGVLTQDAGIVVTLADKAEFQITVTQSRIGDHNDEDDCEDGTP